MENTQLPEKDILAVTVSFRPNDVIEVLYANGLLMTYLKEEYQRHIYDGLIIFNDETSFLDETGQTIDTSVDSAVSKNVPQTMPNQVISPVADKVVHHGLNLDIGDIFFLAAIPLLGAAFTAYLGLPVLGFLLGLAVDGLILKNRRSGH